MSTAKDFVEAYKAWKQASDQHLDAMRAVMDGQKLDAKAMLHALAEIDILHERWMELAMRHAAVQA